ncbi:hypothetical protein F5878DRAFT_654713 [Lentinula raphanica]|uniref:DUF6589 domain-containing protein n=1 Tax=Lentinula raphanica TaxID=153919 RepID=A0AA38NWS8_9AGAR|nr:hypothetical protein F5878DRAFT_654713 [Lentinula raphanica]
MRPSPIKPRGPGRPPKSPRRINRTRSAWYLDKEQKTAESMKLSAMEKMRSKEMKRAALEASRKANEDGKRMRRKLQAYKYIEALTKPSSEGGFDFNTMSDFFEALSSSEGPSDQHIESRLTKFIRKHGTALTHFIWKRAPEVKDEVVAEALHDKLASEGRILQELLTRDNCKSMAELFRAFTLAGLIAEIKEATPFLWKILLDITTNPERRAEGKSRNKELVSCHTIMHSIITYMPQVLVTVCAMYAVLRSQRANEFQAVIGMFLIGSGASKREMEVLHHAGISLSYPAIIRHMRLLSEEAKQTYKDVIKECMCSVVWDNLCIQFRVEAQRLNSSDHFDNGTTATCIPLFDPYTLSNRTPHGTLPLSLKPPRETTNPIFEWSDEDVLPSREDIRVLTLCSKWQIRRLALESIPGLAHLKPTLGPCPEVKKIPLHKTEQYPLPAMKEEENSIDGTIQVFHSILRSLGVSNEDLEAHGLMFTDGDLLTDSLVDKVESARRNNPLPINGMKGNVRRFGIFHAKMAGSRMVVNEHWGQPESKEPGGLWWENNKLGRKKMIAGWQSKKAAPWKPTHELLHISLAAHIQDGFRITCGEESLEMWARSASEDDFNHCADKVYDQLFTTAAYDDASEKDDRDTIYENNILQNRDTLLYIEIVDAIKSGDIGRVVNVFRMWMVMMRSKKTMPKYADAIFETLGRVSAYPEVLREFFLHNWLVNLTGKVDRWKEVDLLQEHQNFWAKIIYTAKGSNRSWEWLAMITPIIFILRNAMRVVQTEFQIVDLSTKHTVPDMTNEISTLAMALAEEKIQTYVQQRPSNTSKKPVRDLFEEGAFSIFKQDDRIIENLGFVEPEVGDAESDVEDYEVTPDDLAVDNEEPYDDLENISQLIEQIDTYDDE